MIDHDLLAYMLPAAIRRANRIRFNAEVGAETQQAIKRALADVGMRTDERWVWVTTEQYPDNGGMIAVRVVVPAHIVGRGGMFPISYATEYPWDKRYKGYVFEFFGRQLMTPEEGAECRSGWTITLVGDPDLTDPAFLNLGVWRGRVIHQDAPVFGRSDWRPGWPAVDYSYGGVVPGESNDTAVAERGLRLLRNIPLTRRSESDREALDRAVKLGREWLADHPDKRPEDFDRDELAKKRVITRGATDQWMDRKHFTIKQVQEKLV